MKKVLLLGGTGLVGGAIARSLEGAYRVVVTGAHRDVEGGHRLKAEEPERLLALLDEEDPDVVISSIGGGFQAQLRFHGVLADWLAGKDRRLLFISTANVFDGDLSRPHTEADPPVPASDYGIFKRDCEAMLRAKLPGRLTVFRLSAVWAQDCPRLRRLREGVRTGKPVQSYQGDSLNITLAEQIGWYARYVLDHGLDGIFHVGTTDTVDYFEFEKAVCGTLGLRLPEFEIETVKGAAFQAVIPTRREIPQELQLTVAQVLRALKNASPEAAER